MDQTLINLLGGGALSALGWLAAREINRHDKLQKEVTDLQVKLAGEYVTSAKLQETLVEVRADLRYIRDRLDDIPHRRKGDQE